jgi:site-specific DNA-methyltransferase (adenine-specific)
MSGHSFSLDHEYETQSKNWIANLPIKEIANKDSVLFLWAVSPMLPEAIEVMKAWGFKYKTLAFCWSKITINGKLISNLGRWTMGNVELCLLGVKGKPQRIIKNVKQLVIAERTKHSKKPDEVRNKIVELMGDIPRIELFAREIYNGWDCLGNDIDGKDIKDSIQELISQ